MTLRWVLAGVLAGCNGGGETDGTKSSTEEGCGACGDGEVCVSHLGSEADDHEGCADVPVDCGAEASCEQACVAALYDLCDDGWIGVGCSDTFPPTIVSCNPDA